MIPFLRPVNLRWMMGPLLIVALFVGCTCGLDGGNHPVVDPNTPRLKDNEKLAQARQLILADRLGEAMALLDALIAEDPKVADAYMLRGIARMRDSLVYAAVKDLNTATQLKPSADAYFNLGNALHQAGHYDRAMTAYRAALELKPEDPEVLTNMGAALVAAGRVDEGYPILERALALRPNDPRTHTNMGIYHDRKGAYSAAERAYRKALEIDPNHYPAAYNLARTYQSMGNQNAALDAFRLYLRLRPDAPDRPYIISIIGEPPPQI